MTSCRQSVLASVRRLDGRLTVNSFDEGGVDSSCFLESMTLPGAFLSDDGKVGVQVISSCILHPNLSSTAPLEHRIRIEVDKDIKPGT